MRERSVRLYLITTTILVVTGFIATLVSSQLELHQAINRFTRPWLDAVFAYGTHLADGLVPLAIGLAFLFVRWRWFLLMAAGVLGSALVAQLLKRTLFGAIDRPSMFMAEMPGLRLVPEVEMLHHNSFPSGHSTCAFSMFLVLVVIVQKPKLAVAGALLAGMLAFSRVYLSQHFMEDVLCGAAIGTITAWLAYQWLYVGAFAKKAWLDRSLLRR
jgi:membrane-associated phospholipid phosphatase